MILPEIPYDIEKVAQTVEKRAQGKKPFSIIAVAEGAMDKKELHAELSKTLPVYFIPGILKQVDEFPLNKNGKIDRKALMERRSRA